MASKILSKKNLLGLLLKLDVKVSEEMGKVTKLNFDYFNALLNSENNKWYFEEMDWEQLDVYDDLSQAEKIEFHNRMLESEYYVGQDFIDSLQALDAAHDTSGDFGKDLQLAQKKHELLKEYVKKYEKNAGHKWTRDILAVIAQFDPKHYKKAPTDAYYDVMENEKVIDKKEPDPQQIKYKHRLIFNGREFSETMYPKYD